MNHKRGDHAQYLVDLEEPLHQIMSVVADYRGSDDLFTEQEMLLNAMNFLMVSYTVDEAIEALEIAIRPYCTIPNNKYNQFRFKDAIRRFIVTMHNAFQEWGFYGEDGMMQLTFVGWHCYGVAIFVNNQFAKHHPGAITPVVCAEPIGRPFNPRVPFPDDDDERIEKILKTLPF